MRRIIVKKQRSSKYPLIEDALHRWFLFLKPTSIPFTDAILKQKASRFAELLGVEDFHASNGWLARFKNRHEGTVLPSTFFLVQLTGALSFIILFQRYEKNFTSRRK